MKKGAAGKEDIEAVRNEMKRNEMTQLAETENS